MCSPVKVHRLIHVLTVCYSLDLRPSKCLIEEKEKSVCSETIVRETGEQYGAIVRLGQCYYLWSLRSPQSAERLQPNQNQAKPYQARPQAKPSQTLE